LSIPEDLKRAKRDAEFFVRKFIPGAEPDKWQSEALRTISQYNKLAIRSGHGVGKSTFLSWLVLWYLSTRYPARIAVTAPTSGQLESILWPEMAKWRERLMEPLRSSIIITKLKVSLKGAKDASFAVGKTSRKESPEALQGFHGDNLMFVIDEASGVPDEVYQVAEGALTTPGSKVVMTGNPTRRSGYFWRAFQNSQHWKTMKVSSADAKMVDSDYITKMLSDYGEDSNIYRVRVLGEFPIDDSDALISSEWLEAARFREAKPDKGCPLVWGVDIARYGVDRSALAVRQGPLVPHKVMFWNSKNTMESAGKVAYEYNKADPKPEYIYVDEIGVGAGVVDRLRELHLPAYGVNVSEKSSKSGLYSRLRDELWFRMRTWFEVMEPSLPDDEALVAEIGAMRYSFTSAGNFKVEDKDSLKARGLRSPDLADALALTFMLVDDILDSPPEGFYKRLGVSWRAV
jgi:hypothetical protein